MPLDAALDSAARVPAANGECGPWSDLTFGQIRGTNTRRDPETLEGVNTQLYNWRASASVQRELAPNVALNVGYHRTWYGGFLATDNLAVSPGDFDPHCIMADRIALNDRGASLVRLAFSRSARGRALHP